MDNTEEKIVKLEEICGEDRMAIAQRAIFDSTSPCICMNEGCDAEYEYEPDSTEGWCEECKTNSVKSILILMGLI